MSSPARRTPPALRPVLLLTALATVALGATGCGAVPFGSPGRPVSATASIEDPFTSLQVSAEGSDVVVSFAEVEHTEIRLEDGSGRHRLVVTPASDGTTARIEADQHKSGGWPFGGAFRESRLEVVLPEVLRGKLRLLSAESMAGDVVVTGDFAALTLETEAGGIRFSGSAEEATLAATAGDIELDEVDIRVARVESVAGNTTLSFATAPESLEVDTTAGNQRVVLPEGDYFLDAATTLGTASLAAPSSPSADRSYTFVSTAGDIDVRTKS